jgi:hypothetical protein
VGLLDDLPSKFMDWRLPKVQWLRKMSYKAQVFFSVVKSKVSMKLDG